jgi:hypothetical protein
VSIVEAGATPSTVDDVLRHEVIVETLRESGPSLPVRFATILANVPAVIQALVARYDILRDDLLRIGDKVECGLMALWPAPSVEGDNWPDNDDPVTRSAGREARGGPGTDFLRARVLQHRCSMAARERASTLARELDVTLRPYAMDGRCAIAPTPRMAVRASYLVHPYSIKRFHDGFEEVRNTHRDLHFLLTGPWPPYSFVTNPLTHDGWPYGDRAGATRPERSSEGYNAQ